MTGLHFKERKIILVLFTKKGCCWRGLNHNCFVTSKLNRGMTTRVFILTKCVPSLCRVHKSGSIIQIFCLARNCSTVQSYSQLEQFDILLFSRFGHSMIPPGIYRRQLPSKSQGKCDFLPARNGGERGRGREVEESDN